ncbi:MAG: sulfur carrier protein ThiS [Planctomycetota bacterium]
MPAIRLNGEGREIPEPTTVEGLLESLRLDRDAVAVEVNRIIVPKSTYATRRFEENDEVEVVTVVGGG